MTHLITALMVCGASETSMTKNEHQDTGAAESEPQCILCGRCLEVCPLLAATGREELSPRAKLFLLQRLEADDAALRETEAEKLGALCLTCGRCARACPQGTDVPATVARLRSKHPDFARWLWKAWIGGADMLWPAAARLGHAVGGRIPEAAGTAARMGRSLAAMGGGAGIVPWIEPVGFETCPPSAKVVLFPGCLARTVRVDWTAKAIALLERAGVEVLAEPKWSCCGGTLGHAGLRPEQRKAMSANLAAWRAAGRPRIATFCASCGHGLAAYAACGELAFESGEAQAWTQALTPLSPLLACGRFRAMGNAPETLHYHRPCHAPDADPDKALVAAVAGGRLAADAGTACCGMGGVLQLAAPDLSAAVADDRWRRMGTRPGHQVLTGCSGCWLQLAATAPEGVQVAHWLDAVAVDEG